MDDVFCGGPDGTSLAQSGPLVSAEIMDKIGAVVMMGSPRHVPGASFNVGNATAGGVRCTRL
jgi:acetylxylan esterase